MEADITLLAKLRKLGVELQIGDGAALLYREPGHPLTAAQRAHLEKRKPFLLEALRRETEEALSDHLLDGVTRGCWGLERACKAFTAAEMDNVSGSRLAAMMKHTAGCCGDCDLFHARQDVAARDGKRELVERRRAASERRLAHYSDTQEGAEE